MTWPSKETSVIRGIREIEFCSFINEWDTHAGFVCICNAFSTQGDILKDAELFDSLPSTIEAILYTFDRKKLEDPVYIS